MILTIWIKIIGVIYAEVIKEQCPFGKCQKFEKYLKGNIF